MARLEDLPEADRRAVERAIGRKSNQKERTRARPSRAEIKLAPGEVDPGGSCSCGEPFGSYAEWEKHAEKAGTPEHRRWNINVTPPA